MKSRRPRKSKRPIDVFGDIRKPHLEESYIKLPGQQVKRTSKRRGTGYVMRDMKLIDRLVKKYGRGTVIHTHPNGSITPSEDDLYSFLGMAECRTSVIVPLDNKDHRPMGYFIMKKRRNFEQPKYHEELANDVVSLYRGNTQIHSSNELRKLAKKYGFSFRTVLTKGYCLAEEAQGFKSSQERLPLGLTTISTILFTVSLASNLDRITGNSIAIFSTYKATSLGIAILGLGFVLMILIHAHKPNHR